MGSASSGEENAPGEGRSFRVLFFFSQKENNTATTNGNNHSHLLGFIHLFSHSFTAPVFNEHLLCARHYVRLQL